MLPVAWTKGTEFRPSTAAPGARSITYFDRFGDDLRARTGADELRFDDGPGVIAEIDIDAPPRACCGSWSPTSRSPRGSPTRRRAPSGKAPNAASARCSSVAASTASVGEWALPCHVDVYDEPRSFGWRTSDPEQSRRPMALRPRTDPAGGTRLRYHYMMGPGASGTLGGDQGQPGQARAHRAPPPRRR